MPHLRVLPQHIPETRRHHYHQERRASPLPCLDRLHDLILPVDELHGAMLFDSSHVGHAGEVDDDGADVGIGAELVDCSWLGGSPRHLDWNGRVEVLPKR